MVAVEFESVVKGKTIHLPEKYAEFDSQLKEKEKRMPGSAKSKIFLADDFEQPLDDATIKQFYHDSWKSLFDSLNEFSDDFMAEREQPKEQTRENWALVNNRR